MKNKGDATQMLRVYCSNCDNIIRNICKSNQNKRIFKMIGDWLNYLHKLPIDRVRDILYNIEQFKSDALLLPEIKSASSKKSDKSASLGKTQDGGQGGPIYGAGAKSAGSISVDSTSKGANKIIGGNQRTTYTGKNPFAILKASALASTSQTVFPNNFTNLPKVSPPFLDPLEPTQNPVYTLVLDLDETLIHNVEVSQIFPPSYTLSNLIFPLSTIVPEWQFLPSETRMCWVH